MDMKAFSRALSDLAGQRVLVLCHDNADGDAIGAALAVAELVEGQIGVPHRVMEHSLGFAQALAVEVQVSPNPADFDVTIIVDCASRDQLPQISLPQRSFLIDHHIPNSLKDEVPMVLHRPEDSTCQIVYHVYQTLGRRVSSQVALALAGGIVSDTVALTRASNQALAELASILQEGGITLPIVWQALRYSDPAERLQRLQATAGIQVSVVGELVFAHTPVASGQEYYGTMLLLDLGADVALCFSPRGHVLEVRLAVSPKIDTINAYQLLGAACPDSTAGSTWGHQRFAGTRAKGDGGKLVRGVQNILASALQQDR